MSRSGQQLEVKIVGGPADAHRVLLTDLTTIADGLQGTVRNIGAVLAGQETGRGGRKAGWIERATELAVVAEPRAGSVTLDLELAGTEMSLSDEEFDVGPRAMAAFVDGIEHLADDGPLPEGFDPGVLKAVATMSPIFTKGYRAVELRLNGGAPRRITQDRVRAAARLQQRPLTAPATVEGILIAVDLAGPEILTCRIDHPLLPSVHCLIPAHLRDVVRSLVDAQVHAEGRGEFDPGADRPRRLRVEQLRRADSVVDRAAWRDQRPWQELALEQGTRPFEPGALPPLFGDDDDLETFLAAAHGR